MNMKYKKLIHLLMNKDQGNHNTKIKNTKNTNSGKKMKIYQKEIEKGGNLMNSVIIIR